MCIKTKSLSKKPKVFRNVKNIYKNNFYDYIGKYFAKSGRRERSVGRPELRPEPRTHTEAYGTHTVFETLLINNKLNMFLQLSAEYEANVRHTNALFGTALGVSGTQSPFYCELRANNRTLSLVSVVVFTIASSERTHSRCVVSHNPIKSLFYCQ